MQDVNWNQSAPCFLCMHNWCIFISTYTASGKNQLAVQGTVTYGAETWAGKKVQEKTLDVTEVRRLTYL